MRAPLPIDPAAVIDRDAATRLLSWLVDNHLETFTPGNAGLKLGETAAAFDQKAAALEGVSRLLWGMIPALSGGCSLAGIEQIIDGLANGSDPGHSAYWGEPGDMDQRLVEMAAIAVLIREMPGLLDQFMSQTARENLFRWMSRTQDVHINPSNWRLFRILVIDALNSVGWPVDLDLLAKELDFIDSQYVGEGWYKDGAAERFDYYNPCAFHFYGLLYARWHADDDPERAARFIERARTFALSYRHWFAEDGAAIAYGRSMTYRFGTAGFWGLIAEIGHPDLDAATLRGLWSRAMRWWLRQPIFDGDGRMAVGYGYPNLLMSEFYNSSQSPLWALKAFAPLALPADHPFWTGTEGISAAPATHSVAATGQINWRTNGVAYVAAPPPKHREIRHVSDKYAKFAYSSHHGFCVESVNWITSGFAGDNILAFSRDGHDWAFRTEVEEASLKDGELTTVWSPFPGCRVTTRQRPGEAGELRESMVETDFPLQVLATGHSADLWVAPRSLQQVLEGDGPSEDRPAVEGVTLFSDLRDLDGRLKRRVLPSAPNTNLMHPHSAVPALIGSIPAGGSLLRAYLTAGGRS